MHEVEEKWSEFDSSTVVQLLIRHCLELEVPHIFSEFNVLHGIKVYNTTIVEWGESAAITNTNHPELGGLYIARVNMTNGVLPLAFQSLDFPQKLYDIEICITNLHELPNDLDTKWNAGSIVQVESDLRRIVVYIAGQDNELDTHAGDKVKCTIQHNAHKPPTSFIPFENDRVKNNGRPAIDSE